MTYRKLDIKYSITIEQCNPNHVCVITNNGTDTIFDLFDDRLKLIGDSLVNNAKISDYLFSYDKRPYVENYDPFTIIVVLPKYKMKLRRRNYSQDNIPNGFRPRGDALPSRMWRKCPLPPDKCDVFTKIINHELYLFSVPRIHILLLDNQSKLWKLAQQTCRKYNIIKSVVSVDILQNIRYHMINLMIEAPNTYCELIT